MLAAKRVQVYQAQENFWSYAYVQIQLRFQLLTSLLITIGHYKINPSKKTELITQTQNYLDSDIGMAYTELHEGYAQRECHLWFIQFMYGPYCQHGWRGSNTSSQVNKVYSLSWIFCPERRSSLVANVPKLRKVQMQAQVQVL